MGGITSHRSLITDTFVNNCRSSRVKLLSKVWADIYTTCNFFFFFASSFSVFRRIRLVGELILCVQFLDGPFGETCTNSLSDWREKKSCASFELLHHRVMSSSPRCCGGGWSVCLGRLILPRRPFPLYFCTLYVQPLQSYTVAPRATYFTTSFLRQKVYG